MLKFIKAGKLVMTEKEDGTLTILDEDLKKSFCKEEDESEDE